MNKERAKKIFNRNYADCYVITSEAYLKEIDAWLFETANLSGQRLEDGTNYNKIVLSNETVCDLPFKYSKEDFIKETIYEDKLKSDERWTLSIIDKQSVIGIKTSIEGFTTLQASKLIKIQPLVEGPYIVLERLKKFLEMKKIYTQICISTVKAPIRPSETSYWEDEIFTDFKILINKSVKI